MLNICIYINKGVNMNENKISNELKVLALEAINNAGSGHSGAVMSCGDIIYTLYTKHLLTNNTRPIDRDRFVLSNGHACAALYSVLAGLGYFDVEDLKSFRKFNSFLTGHPEIEIPGVDANTGPLGQGVGNAVGMAIAETVMNAKFNMNHYTYCMVGDGCMQEGVGVEALAIAGLYHLNKFILLYDKNDVTLDGALKNSSNEDVKKKLQSMNFNVIECDGHNVNKIDKAISKAKLSKDKPTAIIFYTIIGKDTSLAGSNLSHGKVFSKTEINDLKIKYGINNKEFELSNEAKDYLKFRKDKINEELEIRQSSFDKYLKNNGNIKKAYEKFIKNDGKYKVTLNKQTMSTRDANNIILNDIVKTNDNFLVLSADLSSSTKVKVNDGGLYSHKNRLGKNIAVGIREHAMGSIANGIALHSVFKCVVSTFLAFSNYMIPAVRMAGLMNLPVMFTFSHSSMFDTNDGATHVPIEQLDQIRLIPNIVVVRPCDINECVLAYDYLLNTNKPVCLCLSKIALPYYDIKDEDNKGAYFLTNDKAMINIMASGSEVKLAIEVKNILTDIMKANVVSVPSIEILDKQPKSYVDKFTKKPLFVIEASTGLKYLKYTKSSNIFNVSEFGASGDEKSVRNQYGYTAELIAKKIIKLLKK